MNTPPHFTDRDERRWQRNAEEPAARPLPVGTWLRTLRATLRTHRPAARSTEDARLLLRAGRRSQATG
ncbi:hypothetical protein ABZ615_29725 [Streptomyces sp. NPDC007325]|uniref:hypothetical protein n=1 Tax=Streptomyces sp. NPDC007325 TaxID=3154588 RepID=UPI00340E2D27